MDGLNSIGVSLRRKLDIPKPCEEGRCVVNKFRRAVDMKISMEDRMGRNTAGKFKRLKTVTQRTGAGQPKAFNSTLSKRAV